MPLTFRLEMTFALGLFRSLLFTQPLQGTYDTAVRAVQAKRRRQ